MKFDMSWEGENIIFAEKGRWVVQYPFYIKIFRDPCFHGKVQFSINKLGCIHTTIARQSFSFHTEHPYKLLVDDGSASARSFLQLKSFVFRQR